MERGEKQLSPAEKDVQYQASSASAVLSTLNATSFVPLVAKLTSHPVLISDLYGGIVWINDAFTAMSGWTQTEVVGRHPSDFLHGPKTDPDVVRLIESKVAAAQPFQGELLNYRRDGSPFWIALDAQPILNEQGALYGYFCVQSDISARKQIEADLLREHHLLETVSSCMALFISSENPRSAFDLLLQQLLDLTSSVYGFIGEVQFDEDNLPWLKTYSLSDISWNEATQFFFRENASEGLEFRNLKSLFGSAMLTGEPVISNLAAEDPRGCGVPEGHPPLKSFLGLPIRRGERLVGLIGLANRPDGYSQADVIYLQPLVTAIGHLIDALRRDVLRQQTEKSLLETEQWLEATGRVAAVGAWQLDVATMKLRWSSQTFRMHEVPDDFIPDVEKAIEFYDADARPVIRDAVTKAIADGTPWSQELPITTAKGQARWVHVEGHTTIEDGRVTRLYGTIRDITARRKADAEREVLQAQFMQSQKMESVGRLAGGIAHDFNNMLAVILGHAEMMLLDATLTTSQRSHLKAIQTAGQRSADLTQQLLTFARRQNISPQKVDLNKSVKRMLDLLRKSMGENIELEWLPGEELWVVSIDPVQLDQILANLCMNARDAISDVGRILLSTQNETLTEPGYFRSSEIPPGHYVVLTVSDNGCGMSEATLMRLFEPFHTTKPVGQGPGLGLATVYGIVHQNGGAIDVESDTSIGTTLRVYLPRITLGETEPAATLEASPVQGVRTILLVEDEPALLKIGKLSLKQLGHKVYSATNAREALQMIQSHGKSVDVVISDIILPGVNGWDLARQIHQMYPQIRYVFMSGYGESAQTNNRAPDHPFSVLSKPFDLQRLASAIHEAVAFRRDAAVI